MRLAHTILWAGWDTYLAAIPVALAYLIAYLAARTKRNVLVTAAIWILGLVWLAFLPNTCYLLTEWRHYLVKLASSNMHLRASVDPVVTLKLMVYTAFYSCFSGIGMLAFALAIRPLARLVAKRGLKRWALAVPLFLMVSVGVYLGLILRFNSWDLVTRPVEVWASAARILHRPALAILIVAFGGFLWLVYTVLDIWLDGLALRWKRCLS